MTGSQDEKFITTPLIVIFVTVFIDLIGFGMVIPLLPYYADTPPFNATPFEIGWMVSIYSWMQFFFSPILGRISDRYGRRPVLFVSILGSAVGYFLIGWAETLTLVFAGRIIGGITGGNISTAQAYIADITTRANRAKGMGLFGAAFGLGFIVGPGLAGILSKYGVHVPFYFAAGLSLANAIALYFVLPESLSPEQMAAPREKVGRVTQFLRSIRNADFRIINLAYFLLVMSFSIMTYAFVLYTSRRFGYNAEQNGYIFMFVGVLAVIAQGVLFGPMTKRFGEPRLVGFGCLVMAGTLLTLPFLSSARGGLPGLLVITGMMTLGNSLASPGLTSLASKTAAENEQGQALGLLQSGASLARAVGPALGGLLLTNSLDRIDDHTILITFATAAGIMFVAFIASLWLRHLDGGPAGRMIDPEVN